MLKIVFKDKTKPNAIDNDEFPPNCEFDVTDNGDLLILGPDEKPWAAYANGIWETCKKEQ